MFRLQSITFINCDVQNRIRKVLKKEPLLTNFIEPLDEIPNNKRQNPNKLQIINSKTN